MANSRDEGRSGPMAEGHDERCGIGSTGDGLTQSWRWLGVLLRLLPDVERISSVGTWSRSMAADSRQKGPPGHVKRRCIGGRALVRVVCFDAGVLSWLKGGNENKLDDPRELHLQLLHHLSPSPNLLNSLRSPSAPPTSTRPAQLQASTFPFSSPSHPSIHLSALLALPVTFSRSHSPP